MPPRTLNILFLCTGNTCRSPMAEAIARDMFERHRADLLRLAEARATDAGERGGGVDEESAEPRVHLVVGSAGVTATDGTPAADEAIEVLGRHGIDLAGHRSRRLTRAMLLDADMVFAMSPSHIAAARELDEASGGKVVLLDPEGRAIDDPFGQPLEAYEQTAEDIGSRVELRLGEVLQ